jgi:transposase
MASSGSCARALAGADLPARYGPPTTIYNRFNRWRKAILWDRLMDAITKAYDGKVQMIDTSVVRVPAGKAPRVVHSPLMRPAQSCALHRAA